jgi:hypothetical protein
MSVSFECCVLSHKGVLKNIPDLIKKKKRNVFQSAYPALSGFNSTKFSKQGNIRILCF